MLSVANLNMSPFFENLAFSLNTRLHSLKIYCKNNDINLGKLAQPLRAAVTGKSVSPGLYELIEVLGKDETLARIKNINN